MSEKYLLLSAVLLYFEGKGIRVKVFPEIIEIAEHIEAANKLIANIEKTHGEICEGVDWSSARFTKLSEKDISQLKQHGGETDEYYVD